MKKMLFVFLAMGFASLANAQLKNTKWKGILQLENPTEVVLEFGNDTLLAKVAMDNSVLESMTYQFKDSVLTIRKVEGQSDCDPSIEAKYKLVFDNGKMSMKLVADDCYNRSAVLDGSGWDPVK